MNRNQKTVERLVATFKALRRRQKDAVLVRLAKDRAVREDLTVAEARRSERSRSLRDFLREAHGKLRMLVKYREGKNSLGRLSREMGMTVSETMDFLSDLGISAPLAYDDYLEGFSGLERLRRKKKDR